MNRPVDPSLLATAKIHASVVAEVAALGIAVGDDLAATLDLVLAEYRRIRTAHDNLAATVELCCLPVDGEVSLCDRVRAAGEAQRRADERLAEARADLRSALCLVVLAAQAANRCGLTFGGLSLSDHEEYGRLKRLVGLAADLKGEP